MPDELSGFYAVTSTLYVPDVPVGRNTVPWTLYHCMSASFPVTPVLYNASARPEGPELFRELAEH